MYEYKATVNSVVDGDTISLTIDLGFKMSFKANCRLHGVNAPELKSEDPAVRVEAMKSKQYLIDNVRGEVLIISRKLDKYGRPLVDVYYGEKFDKHLNKELIDNKLAIEYMQ